MIISLAILAVYVGVLLWYAYHAPRLAKKGAAARAQAVARLLRHFRRHETHFQVTRLETQSVLRTSNKVRHNGLAPQVQTWEEVVIVTHEDTRVVRRMGFLAHVAEDVCRWLGRTPPAPLVVFVTAEGRTEAVAN